MLKNARVWLLIALVYTGIVLYINFANADYYLPEKKLFEHQDKVFHFIVYVLLAMVWAIYTLKTFSKKPLWVSFFGTFIFGIALESVQETISPYRTYDTIDLIANCLGVIVGTVFVYYFMKHKVKID